MSTLTNMNQLIDAGRNFLLPDGAESMFSTITDPTQQSLHQKWQLRLQENHPAAARGYKWSIGRLVALVKIPCCVIVSSILLVITMCQVLIWAIYHLCKIENETERKKEMMVTFLRCVGFAYLTWSSIKHVVLSPKQVQITTDVCQIWRVASAERSFLASIASFSLLNAGISILAQITNGSSD